MKNFTALQLKSAASIWQNAVKSVSRLQGLFERVIPVIVGSSSSSWVKASYRYGIFVTALVRKQGHRGAAIYLKGCNLVFMRCISGERLVNSRDAGTAISVSHWGLPRFIPISHRVRIKKGEVAVVRFWLALFTLYRVLDFRGKLSLASIINPGVIIPKQLELDWFQFVKTRFFSMLLKNFRVVPLKYEKVSIDHHTRPSPKSSLFPGIRLEWLNRVSKIFAPSIYGACIWNLSRTLAQGFRRLIITKSGPNSVGGTVSVSNMIEDASAWITRPYLFLSLKTLARAAGVSHLFDMHCWFAGEENARAILKYRDDISSGRKDNPFGKGAPVPKGPIGFLGKLGVREEPGKMRLFAMVDIWTQWILSPLHRALFAVLQRIPQDGTFDQVKPVARLVKVCKTKGIKKVYSYDLSAATDRLPVRLQILLLQCFAGKQYAESWATVLCEREYALPRLYQQTFGKKYSTVKYAVGQPMGALSSWAMLAITHHAIVQFAAYRVGAGEWFTLYAVLGDDVVIANDEVAAEYVRIMKLIGVDIGFHKSIISSNLSLEFAKRFFYKGEEVTPFPLVGVAVGLLGASFVPEVIRACETLTGSTTSTFRISRYLGVGMRASSAAGNRMLMKLPKVLSSVLILCLRPGSVRAVAKVSDWLTREKFSSSVDPGPNSRLAIYNRALRYVKTEVIPTLEKRIASSLKRFTLNLNVPFPPKEDRLEGCRHEWKSLIVADLKAQFAMSIGSIKFRIGEVKAKDTPDMSDINSILMACEKIETEAASIPLRVLSRKPKSPLKESSVPSKPRDVKMWRSYRSIISSM